jgi:hypothetical protein
MPPLLRTTALLLLAVWGGMPPVAGADAVVWMPEEDPGDRSNPYRGYYCKTIPDRLESNGACPANAGEAGWNARGKIDLLGDSPDEVRAKAQRAYRLGLRLVFDRITVAGADLPMSQSQFDKIATNLNAMKGTGVKIILKLRPGGRNATDCAEIPPDGEGTQAQREICYARIKKQMIGIGKALEGNESVIANLEMGYFGAAGEMVDSKTMPAKPAPVDDKFPAPCLAYGGDAQTADCDRSVERLYDDALAAHPAGFPISWRRPKILVQARDRGPNPSIDWSKAATTRKTAHADPFFYRGTSYNHCITVSAYDAGTFSQHPPLWANDMRFLSEDSKWGHSTGETCADTAAFCDESATSDCWHPWSRCTNTVPLPYRETETACTSDSECTPYACNTASRICVEPAPVDGYSIVHGGILGMMERQHFMSFENEWDSGQVMFDKWRRGGCERRIAKRLGYRFVPKRLALRDRWQAGSEQMVELTVRNDGFARFWWPWTVYIVLAGEEGRRYEIAWIAPDRTDDDIRFWPPYHEDSEDRTIARKVRVPAEVASGKYTFALWIPDPDFRADPKYSLRLLSGRWNEARGYTEFGTITLE